MHKAWCCLEEVPHCFSRSSVKFQGHTAERNRRLWPKLGASGLLLQFKFTNGYEMMHRDWSSIGEVPYCFSRSFIKFQGHTGQKNRRFRPKLSVSRLYLKFDFTAGIEMMHKALCSIEEVPNRFSRPSIKFQGHTGQNIDNFDRNWVFCGP